MSDLFHEQIPDEFVRDVFGVMEQADWHRYQVLTKRPERVTVLDSELPWPPQIWLGVSVESSRYLHRIDLLRECGAATAGAIVGTMPDLNLESIDWVIVGGESGPGARPMEADWVRNIRDAGAVGRSFQEAARARAGWQDLG